MWCAREPYHAAWCARECARHSHLESIEGVQRHPHPVGHGIWAVVVQRGTAPREHAVLGGERLINLRGAAPRHHQAVGLVVRLRQVHDGVDVFGENLVVHVRRSAPADGVGGSARAFGRCGMKDSSFSSKWDATRCY